MRCNTEAFHNHSAIPRHATRYNVAQRHPAHPPVPAALQSCSRACFVWPLLLSPSRTSAAEAHQSMMEKTIRQARGPIKPLPARSWMVNDACKRRQHLSTAWPRWVRGCRRGCSPCACRQRNVRYPCKHQPKRDGRCFRTAPDVSRPVGRCEVCARFDCVLITLSLQTRCDL